MRLISHAKTQKTTLKVFLRMKNVGRGQNLSRAFRESPDPGGGRPSWIMQEHLGEESSYNKGSEIQKLRELQTFRLESENSV